MIKIKMPREMNYLLNINTLKNTIAFFFSFVQKLFSFILNYLTIFIQH